MINLSEVKRRENKIFRILGGASKDELNFILNNVRLALLFYKVKDHSKARSDQSRTMILELLCITRLADLTVTSRAILLDAMMVMKLSAHPMCEKWVRNIILKTSGDDLSNLKTYTDAKGDFHSMHKLVFNDIRDPTIRADILNHIKREAGVQTAHMRLGTKKAMKRKQQAWRKVLSDVDDTLYSSGGRYPAGMDTRFPRHALYPGVLSFYRELDMGTNGPDDWTDDRVGNLVFLSARPHVYKDMSEKKSYAKFAALYEKMGMHTLPTMLAGNIKSGRAFMWQGDLEPMAQKKFENFCEYYQLYPEFTHVFVGDNGQGDVRAAELIVEKFGSEALEAAFFQQVQPLDKVFGYHSKEDLERWRRMNIVFFNTYVGAAVEAVKMKKVRLGGLRKICEESVRTFEAIQTWKSPESRDRARLLLNNDLREANAMLLRGSLSPMRLVPKPQVFELHALVRTPMGRAIIRGYRGIDGIYRVDLIDWGFGISKKRPRAYVPQESIAAIVPGADATVALAKSSLKYVKFYKPPLVRVFPPQALVKTPFGVGRVVRFRRDDEIYVVALMDTNTADSKAVAMMGYFSPDAVDEAEIDPNADGVDGRQGSSPRMFSGVRSGIGYITKKLSNFVPGSSSGTAKPLYAIGSAVESPFGRGVVIEFRSSDRVYELQLFRSDIVTGGGVFVQERCLKESSVSPPRSFFSILGLGSTSTGATAADANGSTLATPLTAGGRVQTPYGKGIVCSYRVTDGVYSIALTDWMLDGNQHVMAFLTEDAVQPLDPASDADGIPLLKLTTKGVADDASSSTTPPPSSSGSGLLQLFRYGFYSTPPTSTSGAANEQGQAQLPYADEAGVSRVIETPFGLSRTSMSTPYAGCLKITLVNPDLAGVVGFVQASTTTDVEASSTSRSRRNTFELFGNPFSYLGWSTGAGDGENQSSALTGETGDATPLISTDIITSPVAAVAPLYPIGTLVLTPFGEGTVREYRDSDDVYVIDLASMYGYFRPDSLRMAVRGTVGQPVDTAYGSGILLEVRESDGMHVVALRLGLNMSDEARAYLQASSIAAVGTIKAARGDVVQTPYGTGVVLRYRRHDDVFHIALEWDARAGGQSHVHAFIQARDVVRSGPVEKNSTGCVVM